MTTVGEIAERCGLSVAGDEGIGVSSLAYAKEATATDIAVAFSKKEIRKTKAKVVISEPRMCMTDKTMLYCSYGELLPALGRVVNYLVEIGCMTNYRPPMSYKARDNGILVGDNVVIGLDTYIAPFVTIGNDVKIGSHCHIEPNVYIGSGTKIGDGCLLHSGVRLGADSFLHYEENGEAKCFLGIGRTILKDGVQIGYNSVIQRGTLSNTIIDDNVLIGNLVVVGHDVHIGKDSRIVCQSGIAGGAKLGTHVRLLGQSGVADGVYMGDYSMLMAKSGATKDIGRGKIALGQYGREYQEELKIQARIRKNKGE